MQLFEMNIVPLAQWIARWTSNPKVLGSTPRWDENILLNYRFDFKYVLFLVCFVIPGRWCGQYEMSVSLV